MPTYDYECQICREQAEHLVKMSLRDKRRDCPLCNTEGSVQRMCGQGNKGGFRLLGGGWESENYASHYGDTPAGRSVS